MTTQKSEIRALQYRTLAQQASALADTCVLDRAREQHALSAARWTELADEEDRRTVRTPVLENAQ
ncbi:hypothetical protein [Phenylobacterium deserti]|uniref:Uncharacterized protein n=1 Tax=Phenylobacterium deserti TaxID=1914756 RepID=A0A328AU60_9CAUL|nr:hypothetical protein [Phenylobacterium deserti]RAK56478.1 hypothetical protein DJ018_00380 [Phenylobacterium deserti]